MPVTSNAQSFRLVRHCFWKYPLLALFMLASISFLAIQVGSPNYPRQTISGTSSQDPGGAVLAFAQELAGTSPSAQNAEEFGVGAPSEVFVLHPLRSALPFLGAEARQAYDAFTTAPVAERQTWASDYAAAVTKMADKMGAGSSAAMGGKGMGLTPSPAMADIRMLRGDFGPVPRLIGFDLQLAQSGYLDQYLQAAASGHSFQLINIWLYDHPMMLNQAIQNGLTDDQWGMVKERGFPIGPWYLILPAVIHVKLPNGSTGAGFIIDNLLLALFFLFVVPLVPGIRDLPQLLHLDRLVYKREKSSQSAQSAVREVASDAPASDA
jgi:hypothetical protein